MILRGVPLREAVARCGDRYLGSGWDAAEVRSTVCRTIRPVSTEVAPMPNFC